LEFIDIILGADVLYSTEGIEIISLLNEELIATLTDFDPVLALVAQVVAANPSAIFLTTYKNRRFVWYIHTIAFSIQ
jgi:hypothetical protein